MARDAVIVSTARTPIGRAYKGAFNATPGATLGSLSLAPAIERAGIELPSIIYPVWNEKQFLQAIIFVLLTIGLTYLYSLNQVIKKSREAP